jgi:hypothetical protein
MIGAFVTITRPEDRGDTHKECIESARSCFDTVTVVDGESTWPKEFDWPIIGEHFTRGYNECNEDWVIHLDTDYVIHEQDYEKIRQVCEENTDEPALSFWKYQLVVPHEYNLKSRLVIAVNKKKFGDRIKFDSSGDLCQPSLDGKYLDPDYVKEARIPFYNYEKILKTKEQIADDSGRMDRAYHRHFGKYQLNSGGSDEKAYEGWLAMSLGRYKSKPQTPIALEDHPRVMHETIKNLTPDQWGYSGHGHLPVNKYAIQLEKGKKQ